MLRVKLESVFPFSSQFVEPSISRAILRVAQEQQAEIAREQGGSGAGASGMQKEWDEWLLSQKQEMAVVVLIFHGDGSDSQTAFGVPFWKEACEKHSLMPARRSTSTISFGRGRLTHDLRLLEEILRPYSQHLIQALSSPFTEKNPEDGSSEHDAARGL
jgi:hypothetical protein